MIGRLPAKRLSVAPGALLLGIVAAALVLRLAWIVFIDDGLRNITLPPLEDRGPAYTELLIEKLSDDQAFHVRSAQYLAEGEGYREPFNESVTARWPPGYPLILAALFTVVGPSILAAQVLNAVLGALSVALVYILGARLFDRRAGLTAAALLAFFPGQVFFSGLLMTETLFTAGLLALMWLTLSRLSLGPRVGMRWLIVTGLAIGGLAMVRGEVILLAPALGVYWVATGFAWRRAAVQAVVVMSAAVAVFVPWIVRNAVQLDAPVVFTTTGGGLIQGHAEGATGELSQEIYDRLRAEFSDRPEPEWQVAQNNAGIRRSLKFMVTHPLDELRLIPAKLYYMYRADPGERVWGQLLRFGVDGEGVLRRVGDGYYYLVAFLALAGAAVAGRRMFSGPRSLLPLVLVVWSFVYGFVYVGDGRYHFPLIPVLCLFAAFFVWWSLAGQVREEQGSPELLSKPPA